MKIKIVWLSVVSLCSIYALNASEEGRVITIKSMPWKRNSYDFRSETLYNGEPIIGEIRMGGNAWRYFELLGCEHRFFWIVGNKILELGSMLEGSEFEVSSALTTVSPQELCTTSTNTSNTSVDISIEARSYEDKVQLTLSQKPSIFKVWATETSGHPRYEEVIDPSRVTSVFVKMLSASEGTRVLKKMQGAYQNAVDILTQHLESCKE